jgi:hypothetical protein
LQTNINGEDVMNIEMVIGTMALVIAITSLLMSFYFGRKDHERRRKQSTIDTLNL